MSRVLKDVIRHTAALVIKRRLQRSLRSVAFVVGADEPVSKAVVNTPQSDDRVNAPLSVIYLVPGGLHGLERPFKELRRMLSRGGERVGDIVPGDHTRVEQPFG